VDVPTGRAHGLVIIVWNGSSTNTSRAAGIAGDPDGPLSRTAARPGALLKTPCGSRAHRMIQRRVAVAGIRTKIGNHTFRATDITVCLKSSGKLEIAQLIANHESLRQRSSTTGARMKFLSTSGAD
jgi:hypothetical protein